MTGEEPTTELDPRYSAPGAAPRKWAEASGLLADAPAFWLSTVRPDGRPHVTTLLAVWQDGALHFCTGAQERKARNLAANTACVLTTGTNAFDHGLDVVVEGDAVRITDDARLRRLADAWVQKYGADWRFEVRDGAFQHEAGEALVFRVAPVTAFGFGKGDESSQTRWRFGAG